MRVSTTAVREGDLIRLADGTRGEVTRIVRPGREFYFTFYIRDYLGRVGPRRVNEAGSVEIVDSIKPYCPYC